MFEVSFDSEVLEETPDRALPFLRAIATRVEIRMAMLACGYTEEEQARGWKLLIAVMGHVPFTQPETDDRRARSAIAELGRWNKNLGSAVFTQRLVGFIRSRTPSCSRGSSLRNGASSIVSVVTLLDRLDALEHANDRAATREADGAAMATLGRRGIDSTVRARLRELVKLAQSAKPPATVEPLPNNEAREASLRELRAWYKDWSETARAVIRRRDYLLLMGLARRRARKAQAPGASVSVAPSTTPPLVVVGQPTVASAA